MSVLTLLSRFQWPAV